MLFYCILLDFVCGRLSIVVLLPMCVAFLCRCVFIVQCFIMNGLYAFMDIVLLYAWG